MNDHTRDERLIVSLTSEELDIVDDWRFKNHMPSRSAAIRELLKRGLDVEGFAVAGTGSKSADFGVADPKH